MTSLNEDDVFSPCEAAVHLQLSAELEVDKAWAELEAQ